MFARFDESARMVVVTAQEEARALRHAAIGGEHLVLGIANGDPVLLNLGLAAVREHVIARFGTGQTPSPEQMPFTATATKALELAVEEATYRGQGTVRPAHVLLVLLRVDDRARSVVEALGRPLDEVRERAEAACERPPDPGADRRSSGPTRGAPRCRNGRRRPRNRGPRQSPNRCPAIAGVARRKRTRRRVATRPRPGRGRDRPTYSGPVVAGARLLLEADGIASGRGVPAIAARAMQHSGTVLAE